MKSQHRLRDVALLIALFVMSRIIVRLSGVSFDATALISYWQYLDLHTLRENLFKGVLYDHTQPPLFNLFLGGSLKLFGANYPIALEVLFKLVTLANAAILYTILTQLKLNRFIPVTITSIYVLSPATILFENELFYTSFVSLLLLISCFGAIKLQTQINTKHALLFLIPLVALCLTRSIYHLIWFMTILTMVLISFRKMKGYHLLVILSLSSTLPVLGLYFKNLVLFDNFSTSSWLGMNLARNVFHDVEISDSGKIARIEPFLEINRYEEFRSIDFEESYKGLNDHVLLAEYKNDSFHNQKHIGYLYLSDRYKSESVDYVTSNPEIYLKNVLQSAIIFFSPATRYPANLDKAEKLKTYDIIYSFNVSYFANGKHEKRVALVISAIPKAIIYIIVFAWCGMSLLKKKLGFLFLFATSTIFYVFCVSSIMEHYENMRFRYEVEPIFLILLSCGVSVLLNKNHKRKQITPSAVPKNYLTPEKNNG